MCTVQGSKEMSDVEDEADSADSAPARSGIHILRHTGRCLTRTPWRGDLSTDSIWLLAWERDIPLYLALKHQNPRQAEHKIGGDKERARCSIQKKVE